MSAPLPETHLNSPKSIDPTMATATIQISNSDNKLPQDRWSRFCAEMRAEVSSRAESVYFEGGSKWDAPSQNACWVCEVKAEQIEGLKSAIAACREKFEQDSAAVTIGEPEFV